MKPTRIFAALFFLAACFVHYADPQTCPSFTKKTVVETAPSQLPQGWYVYWVNGKNGLFRSDLTNYSPTIIQNTEKDAPRSIDISDDGNWIVYWNKNDNKIYLLSSDGAKRFQVPTQPAYKDRWGNGYPCVAGFIRSGYRGMEIFYPYSARYMYGVQVIVTGGQVTFGTGRTIIDMGKTNATQVSYWEGDQAGIYKDQIWALFRETVNGILFLRTGFITIPDSGKGTASAADLFKWKNDQPNPLDYHIDSIGDTVIDGNYWGCGFTTSWDGKLCLANSGWIGSACVPNKKNDPHMDHKGFYLTRFFRETDSSVTIDDQVDKYGISINWCPVRFRFGEYNEVDFTGWAFSNYSDYIIGSLSGTKSPLWGLWVVQWKTNTWTLLTPDSLDSTIEMQEPAVYITQTVGVNSGEAAKIKVMQNSAEKNVMVPGVEGKTVMLKPGMTGFTIYSLSGRTLWRYDGNEGRISLIKVILPESVRKGAMIIVIDESGR